MKLKTIELTRRIRDNIYKQIKDLPKEEQIKFYRLKASKLNKQLQKKKKTTV
jgi:hypothetical protein